MTIRPKLGYPCDILYILKLFHFNCWFNSSIVQEEPENKCWKKLPTRIEVKILQSRNLAGSHLLRSISLRSSLSISTRDSWTDRERAVTPLSNRVANGQLISILLGQELRRLPNSKLFLCNSIKRKLCRVGSEQISYIADEWLCSAGWPMVDWS